MSITNYLNQFFNRNIIYIFGTYIFSVLVMYYGYFYPFNDYNLFLFLSATTCLFITIFFKINNSSLFDGFYFWLFFLLLFPKKSIVPNLDSILTNAVNLSDSLLINTNFSFYNIVNFFIVISVFIKSFFKVI